MLRNYFVFGCELCFQATSLTPNPKFQVPPPEFELGWTNETLLTAAERRGRLGILSELPYEPESFLARENNRGELGRFDYAGSRDEGQRRGLAALAKADDGDAPVRDAMDWAAAGCKYHRRQESGPVRLLLGCFDGGGGRIGADDHQPDEPLRRTGEEQPELPTDDQLRQQGEGMRGRKHSESCSQGLRAGAESLWCIRLYD